MAKITTKVFSKVRNIAQPDDSDIDKYPVDVNFPAAGLLVGDIIEVVEIPAGVTLQDYELHFPDIDSGGSPALAFSFGVLNADSTDLATVYASGLTAGQTNAIVRNPNTDCSQADSTVVRRIGMKVTAAAATYAGAGKTGQVLIALRG